MAMQCSAMTIDIRWVQLRELTSWLAVAWRDSFWPFFSFIMCSTQSCLLWGLRIIRLLSSSLALSSASTFSLSSASSLSCFSSSVSFSSSSSESASSIAGYTFSFFLSPISLSSSLLYVSVTTATNRPSISHVHRHVMLVNITQVSQTAAGSDSRATWRASGKPSMRAHWRMTRMAPAALSKWAKDSGPVLGISSHICVTSRPSWNRSFWHEWYRPKGSWAKKLLSKKVPDAEFSSKILQAVVKG
mmetsp:Transcript_23816/g.59808  ORF Transcript_23816/g.59808 Transcript_23816/m.59808 type:complete len:245 (-) Transcript_23816:9-743(-)